MTMATLYTGRRAHEDGVRKVTIKSRSGAFETLDNSWIVPYSPFLCKMFNAHIIVEACNSQNSVHAIKYICKYINKGSDQAIFNLRSEGYKDLQTVNGRECAIYREACEALHLLENDNHCDETMEEAVQCQSPAKIRDLYATLISSCGLSNAHELWDKYKEYMAEDILRRLQQTHANMTYNQHIYNEALGKIEDKVMAMVGKKLSDFGTISPQRTTENEPSDEIIRETNYDIPALQQQVAEFVPRLPPE
ncbi:unnamed protein product [Parnassius apollo]|uniref:(apollo) hypothetical protein n=1 Tax=Parnassius apollo TaxID=110799 RepID=A0A8S3W7G8_PARAO|nr:unnamed protein product [Parnassius apollo]